MRIIGIVAAAFVLGVAGAANARVYASVEDCVTSEPKLSQRVSRPVCEATVFLNANDTAGAQRKLNEALRVRHLNHYDMYYLYQISMAVTQARGDYAAALAATEAMLKSPAMDEANRTIVYKNGLVLNAVQQKYARAVWFGEELQKAGPLEPDYGRILAISYFETGNYPAAETTADAALDHATGDTRTQLRNVVRNSREKQGKPTDLGSAIFGENGLLGKLGIRILPNGLNVEGGAAIDGGDGGGNGLGGGHRGNGGRDGGGHGGNHGGGGGHGGGHNGGGNGNGTGNGGGHGNQNQNQNQNDDRHRHRH